jgi:hypothetical protein
MSWNALSSKADSIANTMTMSRTSFRRSVERRLSAVLV